MRTGEDLRRRCLALPGRDGKVNPLSSPHTTTLIPSNHVYLGGGPPAGGSSVFPGSPPQDVPLASPSPPLLSPHHRLPTSQSTEKTEPHRVHSLGFSPRLLQAYLAHPPPPTHLEEVASPPVSSLGSGGRASCPPASQAPYSSGFHIHPPLDLRPATQQPTRSRLLHQILVPAPRLALLSPPLLRGHSSQKRSPHAPASQVSRPSEPHQHLLFLLPL